MESLNIKTSFLFAWAFTSLLLTFAILPANAIAGEESVCDLTAISNSIKAFSPTKQQIDDTQVKLKTKGYLTGQADGILGPETDHALFLLCRKLESEGLIQIEQATEETPANPSALAKQIVDGLNKTMKAKQENAIQLQGDGCGCSRDFSTLVYGFYPIWLADGKIQKIDFSLIDRIGIHALELDSNGVITDSSVWDKDSDSGSYVAKFISNAHRYRVKVDTSYYMSHWMGWDDNQLKKAVENIAYSASQKFRDKHSDQDPIAIIGKLLRKLLPFVEDNSMVSVDGINLYFDNYRKSTSVPEPWSKIEQITHEIQQKLQHENPAAKINVILGLNWTGLDNNLIDIDQQLFRNLQTILLGKLITETTRSPAIIENLFVFLPQKKTSNAKKYLRRTIEDAFKGEDRRTVLRKTIPIITTWPEGADEAYFKIKTGQFVDDLIYLEDNFAGVGLWPLPLASKRSDSTSEIFVNSSDIAINLESIYQVQGGSKVFGKEIETLAQQLCTFACPNRWLFRLVFDFMAVLLLIYGVMSMRYCRWREFYQQHTVPFLVFILVAALIFSVSMVCDPFWQDISDYVLSVIVLVLVGYFGFSQYGKSIKKEFP